MNRSLKMRFITCFCLSNVLITAFTLIQVVRQYYALGLYQYLITDNNVRMFTLSGDHDQYEIRLQPKRHKTCYLIRKLKKNKNNSVKQSDI